ncbi:hypothetical protein Q5692_36365 [Microcoleus sp. C2C3]|uniref:hypothetical protein n=1 Tax=unclassified Microcoleus TaxID=2642155 RepID=UPI002FCFE41A
MHAFSLRRYLLFRALKSLRLTAPGEIESGIVLVCPGKAVLGDRARLRSPSTAIGSTDRATGLDLTWLSLSIRRSGLGELPDSFSFTEMLLPLNIAPNIQASFGVAGT